MSEKEKMLNELIEKMTLSEKLGQLNLLAGEMIMTGPKMNIKQSADYDEGIKQGKIGGLFNLYGKTYVHHLQKMAVEKSRLGIPLLIGADVIHGFRTIFPLPLGEAASWDMEAIRKGAAIAARESAAVGINWTFAPMIDVTREARWGRVAEGAGEDPFLGSAVARARVQGFQGEQLDDADTIAACAKHFAAYGAPEAGLEYNTVDMSVSRLRDVYLPPFKAAVEAGVATIMNAFNELNGIPATANHLLLREILREEWEWEGMVVSDWQSINEMCIHGFCTDDRDAAEKAIVAGCDMDMMGEAYINHLEKAIKEDPGILKFVNQSTRRILALKYDLGLFSNPYQYGQIGEEGLLDDEAKKTALDMARKSIVLLKNENSILPLSPKKKVALVGPFAKNKQEHNGCWSFFAQIEDPITMADAFGEKVGSGNLIVAEGTGLYHADKALEQEALQLCQAADVICLALGEPAIFNGEAGSRTNIQVPENQLELAYQLKKLGKPMVLLLTHGRPMDLSWFDEHCSAVLAGWTLGTMVGPAWMEVVFGDFNPQGRLPITFPRNIGQVPIHYAHKHTARPYLGKHDEPDGERVYLARYVDSPRSPLYPFGFGLSYSNYNYKPPVLANAKMKKDGSIEMNIAICNEGSRAGCTTCQVYIRDLIASRTRPVQELIDFRQVHLAPGETQILSFIIHDKQLAFTRGDGTYGTEPGSFELMVGPSSAEVQSLSFELEVG